MRRTRTNTIYFCSVKDDSGCFANFAAYPIRLKGRDWPTIEHYYQAQKFAGTAREELIRRARTPTLAVQLDINGELGSAGIGSASR